MNKTFSSCILFYLTQWTAVENPGRPPLAHSLCLSLLQCHSLCLLQSIVRHQIVMDSSARQETCFALRHILYCNASHYAALFNCISLVLPYSLDSEHPCHLS